MSVKRLVPLNTVNLTSDPSVSRIGDIYYNTTLSKLKVSTSAGWIEVGSSGSAIHIGEAAPLTATEGDLWFNNVDPHFYIYDGSFWVEFSTGPVGPVGAGVPIGGTAGQVATKLSATDYAIAWTTPYLSSNFTSDLLATGLAATKANLSGPTFTGTVVLPTTTSIGAVSDLEVGYLDGVTSALQTQLDGKVDISSLVNTLVDYIPLADRGVANGVASLDLNAKVPDLEIPTTIARITDITSHSDDTTNVHGIANTAQLATITYANTIGTTANSYTDAQISSLIDSAPSTLNTLKEISDALGADADFATTTYNRISDLEMNLIMGAA